MPDVSDLNCKFKMPMQYFVSASALLVTALMPFSAAYGQTVEEASENAPTVTLTGDDNAEAKADKLRTAAESLSSILGQAKENGLLRPKGELASVSGEDIESIFDAPKGPSRCETAKILDMSTLIGVENYEDLLLYKNETVDVSTRKGMVEFARLTLSLGLGAEAKSLLSQYSGEDIDLVLRLAQILEDPNFTTDEPIFAAYSDCHDIMPILALIEKASAGFPSFTGIERRELLSGFDSFPKALKDIMSVKLATLSIENGNDSIAKAIWRKLDNDAREANTSLPIEKLERVEYLYLDALLKKEDDPDYYVAVIKHLAERENVYQFKALKKLADLERKKGGSNKLIETTLEGIRDILPSSSEKKEASYELVKNRIYNGQVLEAIDTTKKYFTVEDKEYLESATQLRAIVEALLTDEDSQQRFAGLNNYLYDTLFFQASGDIETLKYEALSVAIAFGLPQLYEDIVGSDKSALSSDIKALIKQAQFLVALKANNFDLPEDLNSLDLSDLTQVNIARQAISEKEFEVADKIISTLTKSAKKSEIERALALTQGQWAELYDKSLERADATPPQEETPLSSILGVLENGRPERAVTQGRGWVDNMPDYLLDMDQTLQKTKAYLKNG